MSRNGLEELRIQRLFWLRHIFLIFLSLLFQALFSSLSLNFGNIDDLWLIGVEVNGFKFSD